MWAWSEQHCKLTKFGLWSASSHRTRIMWRLTSPLSFSTLIWSCVSLIWQTTTWLENSIQRYIWVWHCLSFRSRISFKTQQQSWQPDVVLIGITSTTLLYISMIFQKLSRLTIQWLVECRSFYDFKSILRRFVQMISKQLILSSETNQARWENADL